MQEINKEIDSSDFRKLFDMIEYSQDHFFITGKAGAGKSTFLKYLRDNTEKKTAVLAPTGVAALNVRGQTIHSFFKFKPRLMDLSEIKVKRDNKLYKKLELLIIDEISMVRADIFDAIGKFLEMNGPKPGSLFGGVQLCVVGDLFQLSPVVSYAEKEIFYRLYKSAFFFSAEVYKKANFHVVELEKIYRQSDASFIEMLNRIRLGEINNQFINQINQICVKENLDVTKQNQAIILTTTNQLADQTNVNQLQKLAGDTYLYRAKMDGDFTDDENRLPAPKELNLKVGAQIMFIRNDAKKKRWVNGTLGKITDLGKMSIEVTLFSEGKQRTYIVEKEEWENVIYEYDENTGKIEEKIKGIYRQYPLVHAWAITIHKSQGKTIENIIINLSKGAFAPGQVYVALSRCPKLENISLTHPISLRDIVCDPIVSKYYNYIRNKTPKLYINLK